MKTVSYLLALTALIIILNSCSAKPTEPLGKTFNPAASEWMSTPIITCEPNPFIEKTTFSFERRGGETGDLDILNSNGQMVKHFDIDSMSSVTWNGTDESGNSVSSGVYYYRLNTGSYTSTGKLILLK
jgi:hypothetical protein